MIDLKNYICDVPFNSLEIHNNVCFLCCPSWLTKKIENNNRTVNNIFNGEEVDDIRNSILDGSYKYCDKKMCPYLNKLIKDNIATGPLKTRETSKYKNGTISNSPDYVVMNFDRTCNYKCPSCRVDLIVENSQGIKRVEKTIEEIDNHFSKNVKILYITGSGDPFVSVGFRNYLKNFNPKKYPNLQRIHLHTNASMWNEDMWNTMPNIHKYVKTCEISIDAGTKETYETKTRIGGEWDNLISNLNFINTIKTLGNIKTSFVVQDTNYKEMEMFYNLMYSIFGKKVNVFFGKITNWGTFTDEEFKLKQVWDENHSEHARFKEEFNKIWNKPNLFHNLYEFIEYKKTLI